MKQAVVVIHGIGEQRPMETLRGFVEAVTQSSRHGQPVYWSKPDVLSRNFELRVLKSVGRLATDFYEYYWADKMEGTRMWHLTLWLLELIRRKRCDVPKQLLVLWYAMRCIATATIILLVSGALARAHDIVSSYVPWSLAWLVIAILWAVIQFVALYYMGDAARYLSPRPQNVSVRHRIRNDGVALLRELHERGYDRIIVVGHSLGSVIAYDIIGILWHELHGEYARLDAAAPDLVDRFTRGEQLQPVIRNRLPQSGDSLTGTLDANALRQFREAQREGFIELKSLGNRWRISDFITLGSPLAHAQMLLATSAADFRRRIDQRELPTCPPTRDEKGYAYKAPAPYLLGSKRFCPLVLHHAAAFAVVRWTNLFFPATYGLFGDVIGGRLAQVFGPGIADVPVSIRKWHGIASWTWLSHTNYWHRQPAQPEDATSPAPPAAGQRRAIRALREALDLRSLRRFV